MKKSPDDPLSRRERQAMEVLFRLGEATAGQVQEGLPDLPSYSATRALLGVLVDKGLARVSKDAKQHVYAPAQSNEEDLMEEIDEADLPTPPKK